MLCPYCKNPETKVTDKRDSETEIRRRRECLKCRKRFTTYEKIEPVDVRVIKKDGSREAFNREKLKAGVTKALEKRPVEAEKIDKMLTEIEEKLAKKGKEVSSQVIGELVMQKLKKLDKVAYIRFASVYRDFKDMNDFKNVIKDVSDRNKRGKSK
jgi:transcriptional repressor NrdR